MKKALLKDSVKEIKNTYKRFLSILLMAFLGVGFFAGLRATSPDMIDTIDQYFKEQNVYDIQIMSATGLVQDDVEKIEQIDGVKNVYGSYSNDGLIKVEDKEYVSKIYNDYTCTMSNNISICEAIFKNISITFYYNDDYITEILYIDDNATYNLKYSDFNNIEPIPLVEDEDINISYDATNNIEKIEVTEDVDYPYTVYNYYVANATVNINDEESEVVGNMEIFNNPMYYRDYTDNIIDKENYKKVEEYVYNDNFIIIVINNVIYYLSTTDYEDEILAKYVEN